MESLGQTLCQLKKILSNQWIASARRFFSVRTTQKKAEKRFFVATERQELGFV